MSEHRKWTQECNAVTNFIPYRRKQIAELTPWVPDFDMSRVSVSASDKEAGSPKAGDMIARNPKNYADQWLVAADYFADNFEPVSYPPSSIPRPAQNSEAK